MLKYIYKYKILRAIISFWRAVYYIKIKKEINSFETDPEHVSKLTIFSNMATKKIHELQELLKELEKELAEVKNHLAGAEAELDTIYGYDKI